MQFWLPLIILTLLPLVMVLIPRRHLRNGWIRAGLILACFVLGLMVSADTYHVRHAYAAFPNARSFPIFVVGLVWAGLFCLPPAIMLQALTANAKAHWGYDLLKGVIGSVTTAVVIGYPSLVLVLMLSLE